VVEHPLQPIDGQNLGEVDQRPRQRRGRDGAHDGDVLLGEAARLVDNHAVPAGAPRGHGHLEAGAAPQAPHRGGGPVAGNGLPAKRPYRREPAPVRRQARVADREHAAVDPVQPAGGHPALRGLAV
jgi:hypothetical protein